MLRKYKIEKLTDAPNCTVKISTFNADGSLHEEHTESDNAKAVKMVTSLESAPGGSKLGIEQGPGAL
jgi:hypothetical protein